MDFNAFDTQKIKEYAERAKREWGATTEYQEFEAKKRPSDAEGIWQHQRAVDGDRSGIRNAANQRTGRPRSTGAGEKAAGLITENYYTCTKPILHQLGQMYGAGGEFTENINAAGGEGAAEFAQKAIEIYCR